MRFCLTYGYKAKAINKNFEYNLYNRRYTHEKDYIGSFIENCIRHFNSERLSYKLNYKTPSQYRIEQGFE